MKIYFSIFISLILFSASCGTNINCGFNDGPFQASIITIPIDSIVENDYVSYDENCFLYFNNRDTNMCPVISLIEQDSVIFSLEMDLSKNLEETNWRMTEISDITIKKSSKNILHFTFFCKWTFGSEYGTMKINRKTGSNNFCLSW